jgi:hypothetical protein
MRLKNAKHKDNINKRGSVPKSLSKTDSDGSLTVGPLLLAFFLFVVVGSALFQILQTASSN